MTSIAAVSAVAGDERAATELGRLAANPLVGRVAATTAGKASLGGAIRALQAGELRSSAAVVETLRWFESTNLSHLLWSFSGRAVLSAIDLRRLTQVAADTKAALLYSDYYDEKSDGTVGLHPLIDYQLGSVRDDFDFGHTVLLSRESILGLADEIESQNTSGEFGGWYDLRLRASDADPWCISASPLTWPGRQRKCPTRRRTSIMSIHGIATIRLRWRRLLQHISNASSRGCQRRRRARRLKKVHFRSSAVS